jgi:hypothetical protein
MCPPQCTGIRYDIRIQYVQLKLCLGMIVLAVACMLPRVDRNPVFLCRAVNTPSMALLLAMCDEWLA